MSNLLFVDKRPAV